MQKVKQDFKRVWKILYTDYSGVQKRAVELISKEMGGYILRDAGIYCVHVLPTEKLSDNINTNSVIIGTYDSTPVFAQYIDKSEIKKDGFVVKVLNSKENSDIQLVLICGDTQSAVFYGAVHFIDDYLGLACPERGWLYMPEEVLFDKLPEYSVSSAPKASTRSLFTWGHPINDYRKCIETVARLKFNQIIVWNDYLPINAQEFVEYAHSFGVSVIWGFAWGWSTDCAKTDISDLEALKKQVIKTYNENYKGKGDGIYFQSFTEMRQARLQGKLIAEVVTEFVNETANELLEGEPDLLIEFGLHATSVKDHLQYLKNIDKRVQIIWEDCGVFPFDHIFVYDEEAKEQTLNFSREIMALRPEINNGMVFKGLLKQDWPYFEHQAGKFIMGNSADSIIKADMDIFTPIMRILQSEWLTKGDFAHEVAKDIVRHSGGELNFCIAAHIADTMWFPLALCAEFMWDPERDYKDILLAVSRRKNVVFA